MSLTNMIISETNRLILRNWTEKDYYPYYKIVSNPNVMKYIRDGKINNFKEASLYINKNLDSINNKGWGRFALELKETGELIGFCGFADYNGEIDFGWRLDEKYWGRGLGSESASEVLNLGINKFKFNNIKCIVYEKNIASLKIIKKLNMYYHSTIEMYGNKVLVFYLYKDE